MLPSDIGTPAVFYTSVILLLFSIFMVLAVKVLTSNKK